MKRIILKPGEERRILAGHPWVYDNEIARVLEGKTPSAGSGRGTAAPEDGKNAELRPGEIADVESSRKEYLGRAFTNPASKIRARIYSASKEGFDRGFVKRRIREALRLRTQCPRDGQPENESMRIVFGEADFLPGLIIDRYTGWPLEEIEAGVAERPVTFSAALAALGPPRSWLALQFLAAGTETRREEILAALDELFSLEPGFNDPAAHTEKFERPAGIVEKSPAQARELEGLPPREGIIAGEIPRTGIVIFENGLPFIADLAEGQKTGCFLDQKENRLASAEYVRGNVLDAFSYSGGFAIHAARLGAECESVTAVDASGTALGLLRKNAALNGVEERIQIVEADVFDFLRAGEKRREKYGAVVLDPPAFAKSRAALSAALRGYQEINSAALRLLVPGGVLVSCSCSQALDAPEFMRMIARSAAAADRRLVQCELRFQPQDHPVRVGYGESLYLKCGIYRVL